jgi:carbon monoxide dehydrogenase subunit G
LAEVEHATTTLVPIETVWAFVSDMDNWAAFVTGYQAHTVQNETESVWTLKGDVGVLVRTLEFRVRVTEWVGPTRVRFSLFWV